MRISVLKKMLKALTWKLCWSCSSGSIHRSRRRVWEKTPSRRLTFYKCLWRIFQSFILMERIFPWRAHTKHRSQSQELQIMPYKSFDLQMIQIWYYSKTRGMLVDIVIVLDHSCFADRIGRVKVRILHQFEGDSRRQLRRERDRLRLFFHSLWKIIIIILHLIILMLIQ